MYIHVHGVHGFQYSDLGHSSSFFLRVLDLRNPEAG